MFWSKIFYNVFFNQKHFIHLLTLIKHHKKKRKISRKMRFRKKDNEDEIPDPYEFYIASFYKKDKRLKLFNYLQYNYYTTKTQYYKNKFILFKIPYSLLRKNTKGARMGKGKGSVKIWRLYFKAFQSFALWSNWNYLYLISINYKFFSVFKYKIFFVPLQKKFFSISYIVLFLIKKYIRKIYNIYLANPLLKNIFLQILYFEFLHHEFFYLFIKTGLNQLSKFSKIITYTTNLIVNKNFFLNNLKLFMELFFSNNYFFTNFYYFIILLIVISLIIFLFIW